MAVSTKLKKTAPPDLSGDEAIRDAADAFKMAGDLTRLKTLLMLGPGEKNVTEICDILKSTQPAVSHHLALLRAGRFVRVRRDGKHNYYGLTDRGRVALDAAKAILI